MSSFTERALEAHRQYVSLGRLPTGLLRDRTRRAWERSHVLGANARLAKVERLGATETARLLKQEAWFIDAAMPYMRLLSRAAGEARHAAMLGDANSILLETLGDEPGAFPTAGSLLDESVAGSNGIGTPLADGAYAELIGPEHFVEGFHAFACQGIPVRDTTGRVVGVISVSVRQAEAATRLRPILVCAANGVEAELLRRRLEEDVRRMAASKAFDEQLVEKLRQDIVQSQAAARIRAEAAARGIARNRLEDSVRLLELAERSIGSFRRQAALWQELASSEAGPETVVALHQLTIAVAELMRTESTTKGVELSFEAPEPLFVRADPKRLARTLFHALLHAIDLASGGGAVVVRSLPTEPGMAELRVHAAPAPGKAVSVAEPFQLKLPLAAASQIERARDEHHVTRVEASLRAVASDRAHV